MRRIGSHLGVAVAGCRSADRPARLEIVDRTGI